MKIELSCRECSSNRFGMNAARSDDCLVRCEDCGQLIGTLGQLKEMAARQILATAASNSDDRSPSGR